MAAYQGKRFKRTEPYEAGRHERKLPAGGGAPQAKTPVGHVANPDNYVAGSAHFHARPAAGVRPVVPAHGGQGAAGHRGSSRSANVARQPRHRRASSGGPAPKARRSPRRALSIGLAVIGMALLVAAAGIFISAQLGYREAQGAYDELATYAPVSDSSAEQSGVPQPDFDALAAINPDVVGWIYVPGTNINYPVVQADDNSTYLDRLFNGVTNASGSIFMDCDNQAPGVLDQQTVLYGHQMLDGAMFNQVNQTQDQATFDTWQDVFYITPDATYRFRPLVTSLVEETFLDARTANFTGDQTLASYLNEMLGSAAAQAEDAQERAQSATQVLTLITCSDNIVPSPRRAVMVCTLEETARPTGSSG